VTGEVTIRRCVLRIRRHGGWSWGPDPDALLGAATRALPRLVTEHVRRLDVARPGAAVHIATPIRLHVTATVEELAALAAAARTGDSPAGSAIARRLDQALAQALAASTLATEPAGAPATTAPDAPHPPPARRSPIEALLATLGRWSNDHVIRAILEAAPAALITAWHARMIAAIPRRHAVEPGPAAATRAVEIARAVVRDLGAAYEAPVLALVAAGAVIAAGGGAVDRELVGHALAAIEAAIPPAAAEVPHTVPAPRARELGEPTRVEAIGPDRATSATASVAVAPRPPEPVTAAPSTVIAPALPFLALVPLARCGWLAAVAAILEAADAIDLGPALAAALAYKLAEPPEHGWRRKAEHRAGAAAVAGRSLADTELHDAQRRLAALANVLIAPITAELRRGHRRGAPVLLARSGDDHALLDTEGMFVIASAREPQGAIDAARGLGDVVLVPAALATARLLDRIECANLVFVTDAPPERGQPWRAVPRARLWTNDGGAIDRHAPLEPVLADAAALASELLEALRSRPVLPRAELDALDRIATHAAALALGDLAWTLFRSREAATPILALERFATLDATVASDADRIEVRIPIGRRHADLLAHGYLTAIDDVPWLGGRVVHIMGG